MLGSGGIFLILGLTHRHHHIENIIAKMNALLDADVIRALYDASNAGVQIDLLVRGVCALKPGIKGVSENIRVRSIVGRFLEHTRIFYFHHRGDNHLYLSSADWMYRNFFKRIEVCFPILDPKVKKRLMKEGLEIYLKDNLNAWEMFRIHKVRQADREYCANPQDIHHQ